MSMKLTPTYGVAHGLTEPAPHRQRRLFPIAGFLTAGGETDRVRHAASLDYLAFR
jgi:hypothetical protein